MIEASHLTKYFGATCAVNDVSFSVAPGEIIGLLGPNGSGKTTIMRMLTGFFPPTSGRACVAGHDAAAQSLEMRRRVGYLPESVLLYPEMRVRRFLAFCAGIRGLKGSELQRRLDAIISGCGLTEMSQRLIGTLSKGYRQRVGLAQALLHEPQVLILDEPTVGLDPRQIVEIRNLIRDQRRHSTVLLSTHILPEVSMTCDRVIIIDRGRIVAQDTARELARKLDGEDRTLVRVAGPRREVKAALAAVSGVREVEIADTPTDSVAHFVVYASAGESVRQAIAATVVGNGWGLVEVRPVSISLEDLFVRLVTEEEEVKGER